jgi:hypothetical protein
MQYREALNKREIICPRKLGGGRRLYIVMIVMCVDIWAEGEVQRDLMTYREERKR